MGANYEKYYARMIEQVQAHCEAPVRAVLAVQHAGTWGQLGLAQVSGLGYLLKRRKGKQQAGGLPPLTLLAVTDEALHAFGYKPRGRGVKIKQRAATWDRRDLHVVADPRQITYLLTITSPSTGESVQVEATSALGGEQWIEQFLTAVGAERRPSAA